MTPSRVFTAWSTGIGIATGVLVATALGQLLDAAWGLAILNGLAAGALSQTHSTGLRDGRLDTTDNRRRSGIRALAYAVMMAPALFVHHYTELRPPTRSRSPCCSCSPGSPLASSAASWRLWRISTATPSRPTRACIASPRCPPSAAAGKLIRRYGKAVAHLVPAVGHERASPKEAVERLVKDSRLVFA